MYPWRSLENCLEVIFEAEKELAVSGGDFEFGRGLDVLEEDIEWGEPFKASIREFDGRGLDDEERRIVWRRACWSEEL